jgi:hypothetical protein
MKKHSPVKLPSPRQARLAAKLKWRQLAEKADIGLATISRCEKSGKYPTNRHVRAGYLAALGLSEEAS